jgi:hypothetical protein
MAGRVANTALAVGFVFMTLAQLCIAFFGGPFYNRFSEPGAKPIPIWKVRGFLILGALWGLFMAGWMWRHR